MSSFALGDTHFSFGTDKPMDIFGGWNDYVSRIEKNWKAVVDEDDTVIVPGDISWAMSLEGAKEDFAFLHSLPGKKIIMKGNHDYWWSTAAKFYRFCEDNGFDDMYILNNICYEYGDWAICGTRGWFFEEDRSGAHDEKVFRRELCRLEASLKAAGDKKKMVFLHYPPLYKGYECREILELLQKYEVRRCYYGHLHGGSHSLAMQGLWGGIEFRLVAADYIGFKPHLVYL